MAPLPATVALLGSPSPGPTPELASLRHRFDEVLLCSDRPTDHLALEIALAAPLGPPPLGAIVAALLVARHDTVVVAEHPEQELEALARPRGDVVLAAPGQLTPGGYRRSGLRRLERALRTGRRAADALGGLRVAINQGPAGAGGSNT